MEMFPLVRCEGLQCASYVEVLKLYFVDLSLMFSSLDETFNQIYCPVVIKKRLNQLLDPGVAGDLFCHQKSQKSRRFTLCNFYLIIIDWAFLQMLGCFLFRGGKDILCNRSKESILWAVLKTALYITCRSSGSDCVGELSNVICST